MNQNTPEHTPTPWRTHDNIGLKCEPGIVADAAPCIIAIMGNNKEWPVEAKANAAFIVLAVNAYAQDQSRIERLELALRGMLAGYAPEAQTTAAREGEAALVSYVRQARAALAKEGTT
jgi:hypothetical protein